MEGSNRDGIDGSKGSWFEGLARTRTSCYQVADSSRQSIRAVEMMKGELCMGVCMTFGPCPEQTENK